jgi:NAD(P)-dependent dehydrogenase (short-subunit alcohol dehydrogenase family)
VVLAARRADALAEVAKECEAAGGEALAVPTDVADADAVQALARRAVERFGRIDAWVNAAAVTAFAPFLEIPLEDFRRILDVDVMGYVHGARAALPYLRDQGRGVLINVSSIVAVVPQPYTYAYSMAKAAVDKMHLYRTKPAPVTSGNLFQPAPGIGSVSGGWHGRRQTALRRVASTAALLAGGMVAARRWGR